MAATFRKGGIHPSDQKGLTRHLAIETMPLPARLVVPVVQSAGAPAEPIVKAGDAVLAGQMIARPSGPVSAAVHAPSSGVVKSVGPRRTTAGQAIVCIEIETDGRDAWVDTYDPDGTLDDFSRPDDLLARIDEAGVVGMGGAAFPTRVKLVPPPDARIDCLVVNGAECEPYLTADHRLMLEQAPGIAAGVRAMMAILKVDRAVLGIEDNKPDAIDAMRAAAAAVPGLSVAALATRYPQGGEKQLIQALLGRDVPPGRLPLHVGVVVQNVGTAFAAFEAIARRKPLVERIVTVSGRAIAAPKNLRVRIGTLVSDVAAACGGTTPDLYKVVVGGPMMGKTLPLLDVPVVKATSGLLFMTEAEAGHPRSHPCIRCGRCVAACPQGLEPCVLATLGDRHHYDEVHDTLDCGECGSCQFVCPAHRPIVHMIRAAKNEHRILQKKASR